MKLEDLVINLDLAKQLKKLGVIQNSLLYWHHYLVSGWTIVSGDECPIQSITDNKNYSAFTSLELGEMLPIWHDSCKRDTNDWHVRVFEKNKDNICHNSFDKTEADARAKMLIYLIENNFINIEDINLC